MSNFLQYFANSISRLLLPVDGAHAAACEEMATAMSSAEAAAYKGLQQCIETVMAEVSFAYNIVCDSKWSTILNIMATLCLHNYPCNKKMGCFWFRVFPVFFLFLIKFEP